MLQKCSFPTHGFKHSEPPVTLQWAGNPWNLLKFAHSQGPSLGIIQSLLFAFGENATMWVT